MPRLPLAAVPNARHLSSCTLRFLGSKTILETPVSVLKHQRDSLDSFFIPILRRSRHGNSHVCRAPLDLDSQWIFYRQSCLRGLLVKPLFRLVCRQAVPAVERHVGVVDTAYVLLIEGSLQSLEVVA
jgi:hypothetical protein